MKKPFITFIATFILLPFLMAAKNFGGTSAMEDAFILAIFIYFIVYIFNFVLSISNIDKKRKSMRIWNTLLALPFLAITGIAFFIYIPLGLLFGAIALAQLFLIYLSIPAQKPLVQTEKPG